MSLSTQEQGPRAAPSRAPSVGHGVAPVDAAGDLRISLDGMAMSRGQLVVIALIVLVAALDGYDTQAMAFVAPVVSKAWAIHKATLGLLLGCSLFGMAGGSLGLSPFADVVGRRPVVMGGLTLMAMGSTLSAFSQTVWELAASRAITGLGIGVMVSLTTTIASEFANLRRRGLAVASTTVGFAVGGVLGGLIAAAILRSQSWTWVFGVGAAAGLGSLVLVALGLPESPVFLLDRGPPNALKRLNRVLLRLDRPLLESLPERPLIKRMSYRALLAPSTAALTLRFAVVYVLVVTAAYYMLSWVPQIVADAGYTPSTASLVSAISGLVGIGSGLAFGALSARVPPIRLASGAMIGLGAGLVLLGFVPPTLTLLVVAAGTCGFFLSASTAVFYASMAASFPSLMRVSGLGFVMGFGRLLSGLGPYLAGVLFAAGLKRGAVSLVFAAAACVAGVLLASSPRRADPSDLVAARSDQDPTDVRRLQGS